MKGQFSGSRGRGPKRTWSGNTKFDWHQEKACQCRDFCHRLGVEKRRVCRAGGCTSELWERYLSQGRDLLSSRGTTVWVWLPASKHMD